MKLCKVCNIEKEDDEFYTHNSYQCRECKYLIHKKRMRDDPEYRDRKKTIAKRHLKKVSHLYREKRRIHKLEVRYGITQEEYDIMLERQQGVCAICFGVNKNGTRLGVDHCHATGRIRKLLCRPCNLMIEQAKENATILRSAALYVESFQEED